MIIGCGNPFRRDDAVGLLVARRLRDRGIDAREHTGEPLALLEAWDGADTVILVDAMRSGQPAGTIAEWEATAAAGFWTAKPTSSHAFGLRETIELARLLGRLPRRLLVYGIEGRDFGLGTRISPELTAAVEETARRIAAAVRGRLRPGPRR
jgi:hydrogenase maturation protease